MESQINSLETKIEKMQERFNKDLEEIKESQYIMNNAINEIKKHSYCAYLVPNILSPASPRPGTM